MATLTPIPYSLRGSARLAAPYHARPLALMPEPEHGTDACTCPWWYFLVGGEEGQHWVVQRICRQGMAVRVTTPLCTWKSVEHLARDKARRLNRIYGIPDPGDAPQEQGPGTLE